MSDLVWVAIISTGGAILGASVAAYLSYKVTKRQTDIQALGIKAQLQHKADESRRDRIVATRKIYLDPLRQSLLQWANSFSESQALAAVLQIQVEDKIREQELAKTTQMFMESQTASYDAASELSKYVGQISDSTLVEVIDQIWKDHTDFDFAKENQKSMRYMYEFGGRLASGDIPPEAMESEVRDWLAVMQASNDRRQTQYLSINKRIEELLAGDGST